MLFATVQRIRQFHRFLTVAAPTRNGAATVRERWILREGRSLTFSVLGHMRTTFILERDRSAGHGGTSADGGAPGAGSTDCLGCETDLLAASARTFENAFSLMILSYGF